MVEDGRKYEGEGVGGEVSSNCACAARRRSEADRGPLWLVRRVVGEVGVGGGCILLGKNHGCCGTWCWV